VPTSPRKPTAIRLLLVAALASATTAGAVMSLQAPARAAREDHVGSAACGACHPAAFSVWRASAHARAGARLLPSPTAPGVARCLGCHTTGDAPAGEVAAAEVGCEACHGAGAGYATDDIMRDPALAAALGLRDLASPAARAALCASCHRDGGSTRRLPFDPEAAYKRIAHGATVSP
jgi:hypothetical protein